MVRFLVRLFVWSSAFFFAFLARFGATVTLFFRFFCKVPAFFFASFARLGPTVTLFFAFFARFRATVPFFVLPFGSLCVFLQTPIVCFAMQQPGKYRCGCGALISNVGKAEREHFKSDRHQKWVKSQQTTKTLSAFFVKEQKPVAAAKTTATTLRVLVAATTQRPTNLNHAPLPPWAPPSPSPSPGSPSRKRLEK